MKNLLIVESPAKAKTIAKYLGKDFEVMASYGHIRDLPSKDGSVEPNNDFAMHYAVSPRSTKQIAAISAKAKECEKLILAPDPDREGESIAWHVLEVLKQKKAIKASTKVERVVFNAITKNSVTEAIRNPRAIDMDLVNAQQARRALDYLVGFTISPVLWKKLPGSRSAGRVQSVALRLICDREYEIENFKSEEYWDIKLALANDKKQSFEATVTTINGKKLEKFSITNDKQAGDVVKLLQEKKYQVLSVTKKQAKRRSNPPFTTSSLQQEAARKLGFSASKTMTIAQKLYEEGLITYMRTDSVSVTPEAITAARATIEKLYGKQYLPVAPNEFKSKVKNAQEAHEAIRPTDLTVALDQVKSRLEDNFYDLYSLVWKRMLASQMADVIFDQVIVEVATIPTYAIARAVGSTIKFDGFYKVYKEDKDDGEDEEDEGKQNLPELSEKQALDLLEVKPQQHFTEPPPRFSEASLVKRMEELGIGRPSTYAAIISVLQDRGYVRLDKKRFFPEQRGRIVTIFLKEFFTKYVEYDYTADLEDELDIISNGKKDWKIFLKNFWGDFSKTASNVGEKPFSDVIEVLNQKMAPQIFGFDKEGKIQNSCPTCGSGTLGIRLGKFGAFVGCSNYPQCKHTKELFGAENAASDSSEEGGARPQFEPRSLGKDPKSGFEVMVKIGPYGPYLELIGSEVVAAAKAAKEEPKEEPKGKGKAAKKAKETKKAKKTEAKAKKPKRVSIPKNIDPALIDLKAASALLSLPREVGTHPETKEKIVANIGPFGPYLLHNKKFTSVKKDDNILEIGLNRAVDLIAEAEKKKAEAPERPKRSFKPKGKK